MLKNLLSILFVLITLSSCIYDNNNETDIPEYIKVKSHKYEKIKIEGHDYFYRSWRTRGGCGTDIEHNPECDKCKNDQIG